MPIQGLGIDILHVPRMLSLINRRGALKIASRILSQGELHGFRSMVGLSSSDRGYDMRAAAGHGEEVYTRIARYLGVRWAVKEAAYKALYPLRPSWKELTYTSFDACKGVKPELVFHAAANGTAGNVPGRLHVSVSHDGDFIVASVVAESEPCTKG
ncbi:hypothetical protein ID866_1739 [Astraeus odoratus]|nr:hypothetical protein ID866_1739 [Astraeus odoratus]